MLDATTKRKIDSARQILVGKVPDPKAQVEQITTALVYKFMDDMDKESQEFGGKVKFFSDDLQEFAWHNLLNKRLSGQERMDLYVQAISSFSVSKQLPQLFRDIFKDTFLPYRDPETLSLFLKEIDEFTYDHSEDLGDAFEYLLSILGSQGDAGQFRTPRHIIDFIAEVVDPKKNETILDPACGTAGFLISAYKHILGNHDGLDNETGRPTNKEKHLTPDERKKMMDNFVGYDISPDMVKLSLVNMYLHGFQEPKIYEYDTLTSEKNWDEQFDVIMANPPFMSPKGGIRPHKRFSVQAKRSEVLFVDYILEHLSLKGRAGIIVPEGIIFKSENAYKQLRQMIVEDGLFAVVSLPSGVFNPYSGVKTSILFFDNQLAKKVKHILFVKMHADGFSLGAQRQPVSTNDIPAALEAIKGYRAHVLDGGALENIPLVDTNPLCQFVSKEEIAESGDYNLTGDIYREVESRKNQKWPMVELGDVCKTVSGGTPLRSRHEYYQGGTVSWLKSGEVDQGLVYSSEEKITELGIKNSSAKLFPKNTVLIAMYGATAGKVGLLKFQSATNQAICGILPNNKFIPEFLYMYLRTRTEEMVRLSGGGAQPNISQTIIKALKIPLPPLEVQEEIVEQIEVKQNAINHAKEIIKNLEKERRYFGQELRALEDVELVNIGKIADLEYGYTDTAKESGEARFIRITDINKSGKLNVNNLKYIELTDESKKYLLGKGDVLTARTGATYGKTVVFEQAYPAIFASYLIRIKFKSNIVDPAFYWLFTQSTDYWNQAKQLVSGGGQPQFNGNAIKKLQIPLPSLKIQKQLVAEAEKEEEIIAANEKLIDIMERKIKKVLEEI